MKKHRTYHAADPVNGAVAVGCSCGWTDFVAVKDLSWVEAMETIYAARDAHEETPGKSSAVTYGDDPLLPPRTS